jgi:hypothetical protein
VRSRTALEITHTKDKDIAAPAIIGLGSVPVSESGPRP